MFVSRVCFLCKCRNRWIGTNRTRKSSWIQSCILSPEFPCRLCVFCLCNSPPVGICIDVLLKYPSCPLVSAVFACGLHRSGHWWSQSSEEPDTPCGAPRPPRPPWYVGKLSGSQESRRAVTEATGIQNIMHALSVVLRHVSRPASDLIPKSSPSSPPPHRR
jgi:hypothetical protein